MSVHRLEFQTEVRNPREEVFAFFEKAQNLSRMTPPSFRFEMLTPGPVRMHTGTVLDYRFRVGLLPIRWTSLITEWKPPFRFADVQLKGPFSYWNHTHELYETPRGTLVSDSLVYEVGWGAAGDLLNACAVSASLRRMFEYRRRVLTELFEPVPAQSGRRT